MHTKIATVLLLWLAAGSAPVLADDWTGVSIGIGGGLGAANHDLSFENGPFVPAPPAFGLELSGLGGDGGFFSLGVGADYQVNSRFVVGAFFDYDWMDLDTSLDASVNFFGLPLAANAEIGVENMWSVAVAPVISSRRVRCCF